MWTHQAAQLKQERLLAAHLLQRFAAAATPIAAPAAPAAAANLATAPSNSTSSPHMGGIANQVDFDRFLEKSVPFRRQGAHLESVINEIREVRSSTDNMQRSLSMIEAALTGNMGGLGGLRSRERTPPPSRKSHEPPMSGATPRSVGSARSGASGGSGLSDTDREIGRAITTRHESEDATAQVEDEREDRPDLALAEAKAAVHAHAAANRPAPGPTPEGDYAHLPVPIRTSLGRVTAWTITSAVHAKFAQFCKCERNSKLTAVTSTEPHVSWARSAEILARCKNMARWKARTLAAGIPQAALLGIRLSLVALRLLATCFVFHSKPGEALCSSLRDRQLFIDPRGIGVTFPMKWGR